MSRGLVERDHAKCVDLEKLQDLRSLDNFHQRVGLHYAGVDDDDSWLRCLASLYNIAQLVA